MRYALGDESTVLSRISGGARGRGNALAWPRCRDRAGAAIELSGRSSRGAEILDSSLSNDSADVPLHSVFELHTVDICTTGCKKRQIAILDMGRQVARALESRCGLGRCAALRMKLL